MGSAGDAAPDEEVEGRRLPPRVSSIGEGGALFLGERRLGGDFADPWRPEGPRCVSTGAGRSGRWSWTDILGRTGLAALSTLAKLTPGSIYKALTRSFASLKLILSLLRKAITSFSKTKMPHCLLEAGWSPPQLAQEGALVQGEPWKESPQLTQAFPHLHLLLT